jgi:hypothetical protein
MEALLLPYAALHFDRLPHRLKANRISTLLHFLLKVVHAEFSGNVWVFVFIYALSIVRWRVHDTLMVVEL